MLQCALLAARNGGWLLHSLRAVLMCGLLTLQHAGMQLQQQCTLDMPALSHCRLAVELSSVWSAWRTWVAQKQALAAAGRALAHQARSLAQQRCLHAWHQMAQRLAWYRQQVLQADSARRARVLAAWQQVATQAARWRGQLLVAKRAASLKCLHAWQAAAAVQKELKRKLLPLLMRQGIQLQAAAFEHWKTWKVLALALRLAWHMAGCYSQVGLLARSLQGWSQLVAGRRLFKSRMTGPGAAGRVGHGLGSFTGRRDVPAATLIQCAYLPA